MKDKKKNLSPDDIAKIKRLQRKIDKLDTADPNYEVQIDDWEIEIRNIREKTLTTKKSSESEPKKKKKKQRKKVNLHVEDKLYSTPDYFKDYYERRDDTDHYLKSYIKAGRAIGIYEVLFLMKFIDMYDATISESDIYAIEHRKGWGIWICAKLFSKATAIPFTAVKRIIKKFEGEDIGIFKTKLDYTAKHGHTKYFLFEEKQRHKLDVYMDKMVAELNAKDEKERQKWIAKRLKTSKGMEYQ